MNPILIAISPGELMDRISILQLKVEHATEPSQRSAIQRELDELQTQRARCPASSELSALGEQLADVNRQLWDAEDELRLCEQRSDFGPAFVELARSIYQNNDRRCALRREINALAGASAADEKIYRSGP